MSIIKSFVSVCAGVENVKRDTKGQVGNSVYKYATLDSVLAVLHPLLTEQKLGLAQYVEGDILKAVLYHESGEKMEFGSYNLGQLDKHQARGSAITYGRRYQLCSIFGITQEDDDGAAASQDKPKTHGTPHGGVSTPHKEYGGNKQMYEQVAMLELEIGRANVPEDFSWLQGELSKLEKASPHEHDRLQKLLDEREAKVTNF